VVIRWIARHPPSLPRACDRKIPCTPAPIDSGEAADQARNTWRTQHPTTKCAVPCRRPGSSHGRRRSCRGVGGVLDRLDVAANAFLAQPTVGIAQQPPRIASHALCVSGPESKHVVALRGGVSGWLPSRGRARPVPEEDVAARPQDTTRRKVAPATSSGESRAGCKRSVQVDAVSFRTPNNSPIQRQG